MSFAKALTLALARKGLREADIVTDDVNSSYVSRLISGQLKEPTWPRACAIIERLGMTIDEFRALEEEPDVLVDPD